MKKQQTTVKWIPMPAGQILGMVKRMAESRGLQSPICWEALTREKKRYFQRASILN